MSYPKGCDVSRWQPDIPAGNWRFVIIKIGGGDVGIYTDPEAAHHVAECRKRGIPFAFYWFMGQGTDPVAQARHAVKAMEDLTAWGHKLVCDAEGPVTDEHAAAFIKEAKRLLKPSLWRFRRRRRVGLYESASRANAQLGADFGWVANWGTHYSAPGWGERFTKIWQAVGTGLDIDYYVAKLPRCKRFFQPINRKGYLA